ncbi:MAG: PVC-type heme-binding CxxCH protein [Bacteroidota bacterium]
MKPTVATRTVLPVLSALLFTVLLAGCAQQHKLQYETVSNGVMSMEVQVPITPEQTLAHLEVPEGFSVKVFAAEPDIVNPIGFTWDERGRLWVVESTNYPHAYIGTETGNDRITICEDTDGDGRADKFIRFAENQPLTTAIAIVKGGAIVGQAPDIVFMEDIDGDGVHDTKTPIIDDTFGSFDTHAVMSNFKYSIDNTIWSAVGYSGMFERGKAPAPGDRSSQNERILEMGVFRFSPDGEHLEAMARFNNNTWGIGIGEDNTIFGSTANNNHAIVIGIPLRYGADMNVANVQSHFLIKHASTRSLQQVDYRDGYTAAAGAFPYAGRKYPKQYWGALMVTEPTGHVVHTTYLEPDGAIFKEKDGAIDNLLASADDWVAPVFADLGPDENMWIADWHNPVIQHNPDGRGMFNQIWNAERGEGNAHLNPLRDTEHGRVYVVSYDGGKADNISSLSPDKPDGLIDGIKSTNQFWRLTAQRLIVENQLTDLAPALIELVNDKSVDALGLNTAAVHALWTLHGLGHIKSAQEAVQVALTHPSAAVRKAANDVLPATTAAVRQIADAGLYLDKNLNTRLAAVLKVADLGDAATEEIKAAAKVAGEGGDAWIDAALALLEPEMVEPVVETKPIKGSLPTATITINTSTVEMTFQQTEVTAYEGQTINLVLNNLHPDLHNIVVLRAGTDVDAFGQALNSYVADPDAINNAYVPPASQNLVIASSGVLSLEETETITLEGLPAGTYTYLCTVPGHWAVMQGTLRIEPIDQ